MRIRKNVDYSKYLGLISTVTATDEMITNTYGPGVNTIKPGTIIEIKDWKVSDREGVITLHLRCKSVDHPGIWYPIQFLSLSTEEDADDQE